MEIKSELLVSDSLWKLRSSLMNFLGLWPPDCFWPWVVVAFGRGVGVAGVPSADGAALRFPVIVLGMAADPKLAAKHKNNKTSFSLKKIKNLCNKWNITLQQNRKGHICKCPSNTPKSNFDNHLKKSHKQTHTHKSWVSIKAIDQMILRQ